MLFPRKSCSENKRKLSHALRKIFMCTVRESKYRVLVWSIWNIYIWKCENKNKRRVTHKATMCHCKINFSFSLSLVLCCQMVAAATKCYVIHTNIFFFSQETLLRYSVNIHSSMLNISLYLYVNGNKVSENARDHTFITI